MKTTSLKKIIWGGKIIMQFLNDKSNNFSENQRSYLSNLLQNGELQKFREYYWRFIKQEKMHQSNKDDDFLKEQRRHREQIRSFSKTFSGG